MSCRNNMDNVAAVENQMEIETDQLDERMEEETDHDEMKTYKMKEWEFLKQFIILGVSQHSDPVLVVKAMEVLKRVLEREEVDKFIRMIREVSEKGQNISQNALFLCLVQCYLHNFDAKKSTSDVIPALCRIPTHLFIFLKMLKEYMEKSKDTTETEYYKSLLHGMGSNIRLANTGKQTKSKPSLEKTDTRIKVSSFIPKHKFISKWYCDPKKTAQDLLLLLTKYPKRYDWDHKTLCKYSHVKINADDPERTEKNIVILYHLNGFKKIEGDYNKHKESRVQSEISSRIFKYIEIFEEAKKGDPTKTAEIIRDWKRHANDVDRMPRGQITFTYNNPVSQSKMSEENEEGSDVDVSFQATEEKFSRLHVVIEHLPEKMYKEKKIWDELIKDMPMTAMLKHISHMSHLHLFEDEQNVNIIRNAFTNENRIYPFTHPFQILKALIAYQRGSSWYNDKKKWAVNTEICDILNNAFCKSLKRTKEDIYFDNCDICIDVSQSMNKNGFLGFDKFTAAIASVAVATTIEKMGKNVNVFICGNEIKMLEKKTLMERVEEIKLFANNDNTNLSQPIIDACKNKKRVDAFIMFTMSRKENICGANPYDVYNQYKVTNNANTKLVICSMEANNSIIADPDDPNIVTVCGADADILPHIFDSINNDD